MELATISEFRLLTKLTAADILSMLEAGELSFVRGEKGECLIDISTVSAETLARRRLKQADGLDEHHVRLAQEALATELLSWLDPIVKEAMAIALDWQCNRSRPT